MPIKPENKKRYPPEWPEISRFIREERSGGRCEFDWNGERCKALNGKPHPETGSIVVLTVAHLDHTPENCDLENLKAGCQRCHLHYDRKIHLTNRVRCQTTPDIFTGKTGSPHEWRD